MAGFSLEQRQAQTLSQSQVMSRRQIQSLELLSLGTDDLRDRIYEEAEKNPALEIVRDAPGRNMDGSTRISSRSSRAQDVASDRFLAALESHADGRTSLKEHLLSQFTVLPLSESEIALGKTLIHNLDGKGFHILSPLSLLDKSDAAQTPAMLEHCLSVLQGLDPTGTCTSGTEESLFVQAKLRKDASPLALFILDGNLRMLDPPQPQKVLRKIEEYKEHEESLFAAKKNPYLEEADLTEEAAEKAIRFIRTLDPFPARDFGTDDTHYVSPDIYVERLSGTAEPDESPGGTFRAGNSIWRVRGSSQSLPEARVSEDMLSLKGSVPKEIQQNVAQAKDFIRLLEYRRSTILSSACIIVRRQAEFFEKGPGHLVPLRQADVARALGVHETTISRMASSKYLQCEWGLFSLKYFFTGAASKSASPKEAAEVSRDTVLRAMREILSQKEEQTAAKKMSDRRLSDTLAQRGIHVARRTVAKYRSLLDIGSSYER